MNRKLLVLLACLGFGAAACVTPGGGGGGPVANVAPTAVIGASSTSGVAHLSVDFSAAASTDSDGTIVSYAWDFGDGNTSTDADAQNLYTEAGGYLVELTVTDDDGATDTVTQIITATDDPEGRYVATDGVDAPGCQASLSPCLTVTYAVGQADASGDTVYVDSGTYPEMVYVAKDVAFKGANQGNSAGAAPDARRAESTLKGIRTGTVSVRPGTVQRSIQIDGMAFDPQGDAALIPAQNTSLVWLYGGANTVIENSAFVGGAYTPDCSFSCTTNTDRALEVRTGDILIQDNSFANFKRATSFYQNGTAGVTITSAAFIGNRVTGYTSQGLQIAPSGANKHLNPGATVEGNIFDATGFTAPSSPGSIVVTTGANTYTENTFVGASSGIYLYLCTGSAAYVVGGQTIVDNVFEANGTAVVVYPEQPANCAIGNIDGTVINDNNFNSGTGGIGVGSAATYFAGGRAPIDVTCNWWGDVLGPNTGGRTATVDANIVTSPWLDAAAPGGACTGV